MGIINALASGVQAGADAAGNYYGKAAIADEMARIDELKQQRLMEAKANVDEMQANRMRNEQVGRIDQTANGIINQRMASKYAGSNAAVADADAGNTNAPLTDEQRAIILQSKQADVEAMQNNPDIRTQAAIRTGDIAPKDVMVNTSKSDVAQMRFESYKDRTEMMGEMAKVRAQAQVDAAQLRVDAMREKAANGKAEKSTLNAQLNSETQNIRATTSLIGTLTRQLPELTGATNAAARADVQAQIKEYQRDIRTSKATKNMVLKQLGLPTQDDLPDDDKAPPAPDGKDPLGLFKK